MQLYHQNNEKVAFYGIKKPLFYDFYVFCEIFNMPCDNFYIISSASPYGPNLYFSSNAVS